MKASQLFAPTLRQAPHGAASRGEQLLLRAGYVRNLPGGARSLLPLAGRVLRKLEKIIRDEMDGIGAQEVLLTRSEATDADPPGSLPRDAEAALDRRAIAHLVATEIRSHRGLPLLLYQMDTDLPRERPSNARLVPGAGKPRQALFSFDVAAGDSSGAAQRIVDAYGRILERCGLEWEVVSGFPDGDEARTLIVSADSGGQQYLRCAECGFASTLEATPCLPPAAGNEEPPAALEVAPTPGAHTVEQVVRLLSVDPGRLVKTLLYRADDLLVAALVPGDVELNERNLAAHLGSATLRMAEREEIEAATGAPVGFAGPVGLKGVRLVADHAVFKMVNFITGANQADAHLVGVNLGRDFSPEAFADLRLARPGDACAQCRAGGMEGRRGIRVASVGGSRGREAELAGAFVQDAQGRRQGVVGSCSEISLWPALLAVAETLSDDRGLVWPAAIAPFHAHLLLLDVSRSRQRRIADRLYENLRRRDLEVLYDEREERAGVKFKDSDLMGIPFQVIVGSRAEQEGTVEIRKRTTNECRFEPPRRVGQFISGDLR